MGRCPGPRLRARDGIAVDTNILVYAHRGDAPLHARAVEQLLGLAESSARWAIPWPCVHEFLAIVTHPKIYRPATPTAIACAAVRAWMRSPGLVLLGEGPEHMDTLEALVTRALVTGGGTHDARIAALCIVHGVNVLWSADRDFSRFPALRTRNPLVS